MSFPDKNDVRIKESYLALLILMGKADQKLDSYEKNLITSVGHRLGLSYQRIEEISYDPNRYIDLLPDTLDERISQFYYILYLMGIDGKISPEETELCKKIGLRLCTNPDLVNDLIVIMTNHLNKKIPADELILAVKKYFN